MQFANLDICGGKYKMLSARDSRDVRIVICRLCLQLIILRQTNRLEEFS